MGLALVSILGAGFASASGLGKTQTDNSAVEASNSSKASVERDANGSQAVKARAVSEDITFGARDVSRQPLYEPAVSSPQWQRTRPVPPYHW